MKLSERGELSLLKRIRERFSICSKEVVAGIGDDSAVVMPDNQYLLLTTDMMVEGIHFNLNFMTPYQLGFKIISVNVSDIYAMGGNPRFILLDIAWGGDTDDGFMEAFFDGVEKAMSMYSVQLIGGDLSSTQSGMAISAALIGYVKKPVLRSGARPGDRIYVTGHLGDAACGLALLKIINRPLPMECGDETDKPLAWRVMHPLISRHLLPEARNPNQYSPRATSMIDISDGLFIDLSRICDESGVGARVCLGQVPISPQMKKAAYALGLDPYALATSGGEDYELLFTAPPQEKFDALCIGEIAPSERVVVYLDKSEKPFSVEGYRHWH
ncbi:MAG TPA: thiamine-phosphate kinase [Nitrospiraceae bacterium]|jgi:thiamine-monophosphate kinase|nr:thiamine-phosphate kinase [Nitrospiraceae bacterium]